MRHIKLFEEHDTEVVDLEDVDISDAFEKKLVVFNDNHNTFEHVIRTFMKVLGHELEQAEQYAWIIHSKGKCVVKQGPFEELSKFKTALTDAGLKTVIE